MFERIKSFFVTELHHLLADFDTLVEELNRLAARKQEVLDGINATVADLNKKADAVQDDINKAKVVADNISKLLGK